ncbi:MAG: hypothetical protein JSV03_08370 [Planctomycetota bacterium]|nr:MAG: hypothetical protein JSV03_08370 [Planctomycetota bacterium]
MQPLQTCITLTLILTCLLNVCSCNQTGDNIYINTVYGYRITGPEGWLAAEAESTGGVSFLAPYSYFVNIVTSAETTTDTLPQYRDKEKDRLVRSTLWVNTVIIQEGPTQVNSYNALFIDYTYQMQSTIKAREIIMVESGNAYIITYQAEAAYFDDHFSEFVECLGSFVLL